MGRVFQRCKVPGYSATGLRILQHKIDDCLNVSCLVPGIVPLPLEEVSIDLLELEGAPDPIGELDLATGISEPGLPTDIDDPERGLNYLIGAVEQICSQQDDIFCFIGGGESERGSLQGLIDRLGLGERMKSLGSVLGDQLTLWMNTCNFFVLSSFNEGNPTVVIEALGAGSPL